MYAGLTTADKGALLDAKARGAEWVARDNDGRIFGYENEPCICTETWQDGTRVAIHLDDDKLLFVWPLRNKIHIPTAIAQIADMERAHMQDKKHCVTGFCADPKWLELANEYGWNFCPHCGNRLKAEVEA